MNISTVNELIQSLESAGELSIKETKVMALAKAFKQLAAENVALKASIPPLKMINDVTDSWDDVSLAEEVGFNLAISAIMKNIPDTPATDRIVAGIKASAIPEGFKLVPEQMYLSDEDIQAICMQCGNGDKKGYGDYEDGILWVGELSNDGEVKYGLNIANANYPEEGSITVFEFDEPLREGADK
ncbi:MAG: hypothetical protein E7K70_29835 [Klebsiella sp.]|uniref:hypothetical protein n=1 Tax=Klebsiella sp. TaxID=576 RepID=UPI002909F9BD|nr:hypothetical protein [Klebsiella sp.]MDU7531219.1 hypothetical protein [Klebsiella sp.]